MPYEVKPGVVVQELIFQNQNSRRIPPQLVVEVGGITFRAQVDVVVFAQMVLAAVEPSVRAQIEKLRVALPSADTSLPTRRVKSEDVADLIDKHPSEKHNKDEDEDEWEDEDEHDG